MRFPTRYSLMVSGAGCALLWGAFGFALAADYPNRSVRFIVPWPPGGGADFLSRVIAQSVAERWSHNIVVDNRGGAGGIVGTELAAKAPADGYTWFLCTTPTTITLALHGKLGFDLERDFLPVSMLASAPYVLATHPALPVRTVHELVAHARANPKALSYSSSGNGSAPHLAGAILNNLAGIRMVHVPYKGTAPALAETVAGHVPVTFSNLVPTLPQVQAGRLRALAITGAARTRHLSSVPTVAESGFPGFDVTVWYGVMVRAGTPAPTVEFLNRESNRALKSPEVEARLERDGASPAGGTAAEFGAFIQRELKKWAQAVRESGAKAD